MDCGTSCGDATCNGAETTTSCPEDCGTSCGDGTCNGSEGCVTCAADCGGCEGSCCADNGTIGCDDLACQAAVCALDPFCCDASWDGVCSDEATHDAPTHCPQCDTCGNGFCGPQESTSTCPDDCGTSCGDGACNGSESTATCPADCGTSCGDGACNGSESTASCPQDCGSSCGDGACNGGESTANCPGDCGTSCGDGACNGGEDCVGCATDCGTCPGSCCAAHGTIGCDSVGCQGAVCELDPFCCNTQWDGACVNSATQVVPESCVACDVCGNGFCGPAESTASCPGDCGTSCGDGACNGGESTATCPGDCGSSCGDGTCNGAESCVGCASDCGLCAGDCCAAHGTVGCANPGCQAAVCAIDSFCCNNSWDGICAGEAQDEVVESCPQCDVCGNGYCGFTENTANCSADCGSSCGDGACNGGESTANCPGDCGTSCGDGVCNGAESGCSCSSDCGACGCSHSLCQTGAALVPGCDPNQCVTDICNVDGFCCNNSWDSICIGEVESVCGFADCNLGTCAHSLCVAGVALVSGCSPCATSICAADPFCCNNSWDSICVGEVVSVCGLACGVE